MRSRALLPAGIAGAIVVAAWVPTIGGASAAVPSLPTLSAEQVVAKALGAHIAGFSGTVAWTADLGLPSLGGLTSAGGQGGGYDAFDPTSLLSGTHTFSVWDAGADRQRLALPGSLSEVDLIHNGDDLYYYDSGTQKVTHYTGAAAAGRQAPDEVTGTELTPDQAATKLLSSLDASTVVSPGSGAYVAGRPAYQLVLTPKATDSTIGAVTVAVDAATGMPLRVQAFPKASSAVALSLAFTSVSFAVPGASTFAAPHGSSEVNRTLSGEGDHAARAGAPPTRPAHMSHPMEAPSATTAADAGRSSAYHSTLTVTYPRRDDGDPTTIGTGWGTVAVLDGSSGEILHRLGQVGSSVSGTWGSGTLVTSRLVNVLALPDGRVLAGFVTPAALEAAVTGAG